LIDSLEEPKVPFHWIPKLSAFKTSTAPIDGNDNILQPTGDIVVPIAIESMVHKLTVRTTISEDWFPGLSRIPEGGQK
jgi:hypothetical protein